ncbi:MAG: hypothetical protein J6X37_03310 [Treponema sp.]|uniref:PG0541 family transporter-associated protein n=1 Tax=Treponema sp. TaxID=166 RepID=UPI001B4C9E3E|nr:PG0541 family transporter-associated protein [Treponema sp.]MBP5587735.1 hypothetical protein [Treponema sp.]
MAAKLVRVEIIFSQAVEEDFFDAFREKQVAYYYTKISGVTGAGISNPKLGDAIWPQLNQMFVIYCDKEEAEVIVGIVEELRKSYPTEGIACFISSAESR